MQDEANPLYLDTGLRRFREYITAALAIIICLGTMVMIGLAFVNVSVPETFNRAKDLLLFLNPLVGLVLVSLLTIGKRFPNHFNYPVKITPENAELQHTLAIHFLDRITIVSAVMLGYMSIQQMRTALNLANGLGVWTMLLMVAALFGAIGAYLIRALRAR